LVGLRYDYVDKEMVLIQPTGDPTFLHPDYKIQKVYDFLDKIEKKQIIISNPRWQDDAYGSGWSWNDYQETYMVERSSMPIYGNIVRFEFTGKSFTSIPKYFNVPNEIYDKDVVELHDSIGNKYMVERDRDNNNFSLRKTNTPVQKIEVPFVTNIGIASALLKDTLKKAIATDFDFHLDKSVHVIHSQPTDSLLKPMMHRSDNFFAEQSLLMVSNERLGYMSDEKIIDTLLKTDFKDLPQKPRWVDGSGLSRYNLFTPQDFVSILHKIKNEFGMDRIKNMLPTGNEGTLEGRFIADSNYIFAKTGTLSGVVALSGYLYTKKNKLLIFSILVNNHQSSATAVRRAVEKFIRNIRNNK